MRRFFALFLLTSMFVLPFVAGCFPSGYEEDNPARPPENQVDVDNLESNGETPTETPAEGPAEPSGE